MYFKTMLDPELVHLLQYINLIFIYNTFPKQKF